MNFNRIAPVYEWVHRGALRTVRQLEQLQPFDRRDRVLDIGGGTGRVAQHVATKVSEITVLDPALGMVELCRAKIGLRCVVGTAQSIPFPDASFDKVIMVDAFHHFPDQERAIHEIKRVLRPGGVVLVQEYNPATLGGWAITIIEKIAGEKSKFLTPQVMADFWASHGFRVQALPKHRSYWMKLVAA